MDSPSRQWELGAKSWNGIRSLLRAVALAGLAATALWAWPWSRDLVEQIITRPQQFEMLPPPGSIPRGAESPRAREQAAASLRNPLMPTPENLAKGKVLYDTYCLVCHGAAGRGDGPVAGGALQPADLTMARIQAQPDGLLYDTIRHGFGLMPAYYERLAPEERWRVVLYVRSLGKGQ
ncbi:MAG: cytochrome c [Acidobacteria bacterium]|nr:cytochrome c [Acidobacteriota bacterium]